MNLANNVAKKALIKRGLLWGLALVGLLLLLAYVVFFNSTNSSDQMPSMPANELEVQLAPEQAAEVTQQQTLAREVKTLAEPAPDPNYKKFNIDLSHLKNIQHAIGDTAASVNRLEGVRHIKIDSLEGLKGLEGLNSLNALDGLKGLDKLGVTHVEPPKAEVEANHEALNSNENISTGVTNTAVNTSVDEQSISNATPMPEAVNQPLVEATEVAPQ